MNVVNTQIAYILHKRAYRETSSILEVLTKDYGRVSIMARGSRGARTKIAASLLPFTPLVISWQGRGDLPYLKSVERADLKAPVLKNRALLSAMYVNELIMYLLHKDDVQEAVFEQYHHCLYSLADDSQLEISLRRFEIKLLQILGFGLNLHAEAGSGESIYADRIYHYQLEHGAVPVRGAGSDSSHLPRVSGACLLALADDDYAALADNPVYLAELKRLMRYALNHYLGNKKLKSRELFRPVSRS